MKLSALEIAKLKSKRQDRPWCHGLKCKMKTVITFDFDLMRFVFMNISNSEKQMNKFVEYLKIFNWIFQEQRFFSQLFMSNGQQTLATPLVLL